MPIIAEEGIAASEVEGLRDPLVGREVDKNEPLVRCRNCDTTYFRSSYDSLVQSNHGQCLTCKADKFVSLRFSRGRPRPDRWGKVASGDTTKGAFKRQPSFTVPLPAGRQRLAPPVNGESWHRITKEKLEKKAAKIRNSERAPGDKMHKHIVRWQNYQWGEHSEIYFATDYSVYRMSGFRSISKVARASLLGMGLLADFDLSPLGEVILASTNFVHSTNGVKFNNPDLRKFSPIHQDFNKIGTLSDPNRRRVAHLYRGISEGTEKYYLETWKDNICNTINVSENWGRQDERNWGLQYTRILWSPTGRLFITFAWAGGIPIGAYYVDSEGRVDANAVQDIVPKESGWYFSPVWHPKEDFLAISYGIPGTVPKIGFHILDFRSGTPPSLIIDVTTGQSDFAKDISWSPDGRFIATASDDSTIFVYDVETEEQRVLYGHQSGVRSVAFSPDGQRLASSGGGRVNVWATATGAQVASFDASGFGHMKGSPWSYSGRELIIDDTRLAVVRLE